MMLNVSNRLSPSSYGGSPAAGARWSEYVYSAIRFQVPVPVVVSVLLLSRLFVPVT